jgi:hypothetical protein
MVQATSSSQYFRKAALQLFGAAALLIVGVPLVPMVVPGYTQPHWMDLSFPLGIGFALIGLGILW